MALRIRSLLLAALSVESCASSVAPAGFDTAVVDAVDTARPESGRDSERDIFVPDMGVPGATVHCGAIECSPTQFCLLREVMSVRQPPVCVPGTTVINLVTDRVAVYCDEHADCGPGELCKQFLGELARIACGPASTPCFRGERRLCSSIADCPTCDRVLNPPQACNAFGLYPVNVCLY